MEQSKVKSSWKWPGALPAIGVLAVGVIALVVLASSRPEPEVIPPQPQVAVVEIIIAKSGPEQVKVEAMGVVSPSRELMVFPQVSGRVVEVSPNLVPGGRLTEGEVIAKIDDRDYRAAKRQTWAQVEDAQAAWELEQGRQAVAQREWEVMGREGEKSGLALRKPQLASARARLDSARAAHEQARLSLERCVVKAPFDALVRDKFVEVGQLAGPQTQMARLAGAERYWVTANVPVGRLSWIALPGPDGSGGARAVVTQEIGDGLTGSWPGRVIRLLGDLEPAGRMARLLIEVEDPFGREHKGPALPLLIDAYARVEIDGPVIEDAIAIPREAVREGGRVWVMNSEDRLEIREPKIAWKRDADVLVTMGIEDGERIVVSSISTPLPGLALRVSEAADPAQK